jgi:hypothetical protein
MGGVSEGDEHCCVVEVETGELVYAARRLDQTEVETVMAMRSCYRWMAENRRTSAHYKVVRPKSNHRKQHDERNPESSESP